MIPPPPDWRSTGSYEGDVSFLKKLERITAKKFTEKTEDSE